MSEIMLRIEEQGKIEKEEVTNYLPLEYSHPFILLF